MRQYEAERLDIWLRIAQCDFLDAPYCIACGQTYDRIEHGTGFIANCDCDEQAHFEKFRSPQYARDMRNKIMTATRRS